MRLTAHCLERLPRISFMEPPCCSGDNCDESRFLSDTRSVRALLAHQTLWRPGISSLCRGWSVDVGYHGMGRSRSFDVPCPDMVVRLCLGRHLVSFLGRTAVSRIAAGRTHRAWLDTIVGMLSEWRQHFRLSTVYGLSPLEP